MNVVDAKRRPSPTGAHAGVGEGGHLRQRGHRSRQHGYRPARPRSPRRGAGRGRRSGTGRGGRAPTAVPAPGIASLPPTTRARRAPWSRQAFRGRVTPRRRGPPGSCGARPAGGSRSSRRGRRHRAPASSASWVLRYRTCPAQSRPGPRRSCASSPRRRCRCRVRSHRPPPDRSQQADEHRACGGVADAHVARDQQVRAGVDLLVRDGRRPATTARAPRRGSARPRGRSSRSTRRPCTSRTVAPIGVVDVDRHVDDADGRRRCGGRGR